MMTVDFQSPELSTTDYQIAMARQVSRLAHEAAEWEAEARAWTRQAQETYDDLVEARDAISKLMAVNENLREKLEEAALEDLPPM